MTLLFVLTLEPETDEDRVTLSRSWTLMLLVAAELEDLVAEVLDDLVAEVLEDLVAVVLVVERVVLLLLLPLFRRV